MRYPIAPASSAGKIHAASSWMVRTTTATFASGPRFRESIRRLACAGFQGTQTSRPVVRRVDPPRRLGGAMRAEALEPRAPPDQCREKCWRSGSSSSTITTLMSPFAGIIPCHPELNCDAEACAATWTAGRFKCSAVVFHAPLHAGQPKPIASCRGGIESPAVVLDLQIQSPVAATGANPSLAGRCVLHDVVQRFARDKQKISPLLQASGRTIWICRAGTSSWRRAENPPPSGRCAKPIPPRYRWPGWQPRSSSTRARLRGRFARVWRILAPPLPAPRIRPPPDRPAGSTGSGPRRSPSCRSLARRVRSSTMAACCSWKCRARNERICPSTMNAIAPAPPKLHAASKPPSSGGRTVGWRRKLPARSPHTPRWFAAFTSNTYAPGRSRVKYTPRVACRLRSSDRPRRADDNEKRLSPTR